MPLPLLALGAIAAAPKLLSGVTQLFQGGKIHPQFTPYQANPYAAEQLGVAKNAMNGRMAGADAAERGIANSQANMNANASRNSSDGAQALAMGMLGQGQANQGYEDLASREAANKQALLGNLNSAYATNINEGDKVFNSQLQKYQMDAQAKAALNADGQKNNARAAGDFAGSMLMGQGGGDIGKLQKAADTSAGSRIGSIMGNYKF